MLRSNPEKTRAWQRRSRAKAALRRRNRPQRALKSAPHRKAAAAGITRQGLQGGKRRGISSKPAKRLTTKPDPELAVWSRKVRERDDYTCRMTGIRDVKRNIAHHVSPRARRPDLRLDVRNGITLTPEAHQWVHDNPREAERRGLLNFDSYELAQKIKTGYVVPGDEEDFRVTL